MFKIDKDLEKYKGVPPYASEMYGIFQPLLGWESKMTKQWIQRGGSLMLDPQIKRILDQRILPAPMQISNEIFDLLLVTPLSPGTIQSPYKVILTKDLNSQLMNLLLEQVQTWVESSNGKLPADASEWKQVIKGTGLLSGDQGMQTVNTKVRSFVNNKKFSDKPAGSMSSYLNLYLEMMKYESQIAQFLLSCLKEGAGLSVTDLNKIFTIQVATPLSDILRSSDPLASDNFDPTSKDGALSPIGYVHMFRQYFFDLGTFLGEPVEHIWLAPGTTIELYEISTRKTTIERTQESLTETTSSSEEDSTTKDELSDAVKSENKNDIKLGMSVTSSGTMLVENESATANFGLESSMSTSKESMHKQSKEQTHKLANQIKQSFKSTFKTTTEVTDTTSKRHIITNPTPELINYELRRKMRRVGVQMQDIGSRLCWQMFVDDAGSELGLAELVDFIESPDTSQLKGPDLVPPAANIPVKIIVHFPFRPYRNYNDNNTAYRYAGYDKGDPNLLTLGKDVDGGNGEIVMECTVILDAPPKVHYELDTSNIMITNVPQNQRAISKQISVNGNQMKVILDYLHFGGANVIDLEVTLIYKPTPDAQTEVDNLNAALIKNYDNEKNQLYRKSYMEAIRTRIENSSTIKQRPSWDLREEERTVIYRKLLKRLMIDSWDLIKNPLNDTNQRLAHVRSEVIRSLFDVDNMLYFVAPEWWMPRLHESHYDLNTPLKNKTLGDEVKTINNPISLTSNDIVTWGGKGRPDNYKITEKSAPARLGSSLGWLLQLDGDNLRNSFLNAPWVKAVIPIRPGREKAALKWLKETEGHDGDCWDIPYIGTEPEYAGKKMGEVLEIIADDLQKQNSNIDFVLATDKVFEHGFDHLAGGFAAGLDPAEVFSQSITVLPTDQIVAVKYETTDLLVEEE